MNSKYPRTNGVFLSFLWIIATNFLIWKGASSAVLLTIREYAVFSTVGIMGVYISIIVGFLVYLYTQKSVFIPHGRQTQGRRNELRVINSMLLFSLVSSFAISFELLLKIHFSNSLIFIRIVAVMTLCFLIPRIPRAVYLFGINRW